MPSQRIEVGKDGKGVGSQLTNWEAGGVEGICANADLVAVEPAVAIAIRDSCIRAERRLVSVKQSITIRVNRGSAVGHQRVRPRGKLGTVGDPVEVAVRTSRISTVNRSLVRVWNPVGIGIEQG